MTSQFVQQQESQPLMEGDSHAQMIQDPQIINDIPSPDNVFECPPFVECMQIDNVAKKIRKIYRALRREQNLSKNIKNYDKYKDRCIKCKLNPRPIELLIAEQENLRGRLLSISTSVNFINF